MSDPFERVDQFAEALIRGRRPRRFRVASREDAGALRMAAALAAEGGRSEPDEAYVLRLRTRLRSKAGARGPVASGRRGFLAAGLAGLAAGISAGLGIVRVSTPEEPATTEEPASGRATIARETGHWFTVARLSELGPQATLRFTAGAVEGHLVKRGDEILAISAICSHLPCSLVYRSGNDDFLCPCHDATFHPDGQPKYYRRPYAPLTRFDVTVKGDEVMVWSVDVPTADSQRL